MKHAVVSLALLGLTALALAQRTSYGQPFSISGVPAAEPLEAPIRAARLEGGILSLEVGSARLVVAPVPIDLEHFPFAGSSLRAERRNHPDGPETRLEFRAPSGQTLVIGSQTATRSVTVAGWQFTSQTGTTLAGLRSESRGAYLRLGRTTRLRDGTTVWCVRLLGLHVPEAAKPGVALEAEGPRFDWTARNAGLSGGCPTP